MKPKSPASFSAPIWIALRLKNLQAQNKNFCRVLDIRVAQIVEPNLAQTVLPDQVGEPLRDPIRAYQPAE